MGNVNRTLSYLKRNGILKTMRMSLQRLREDREEKEYESQRRRAAVSCDELRMQEEYAFGKRIRLSVLIPAYETDEEYLRILLDSILVQSYGDFEVIIADAGKSGAVSQVVAGFDDDRLVYIKLNENRGISENTNEALERATGEAVVFVDHDDFLEPDAFFCLARAFEDGAWMVYTDEDKYETSSVKEGRYYRPNIKPDFDYDLLLSNNYISHLFAVKTDIVRSIGGLRKAFDGAQDYDLILRCADFVFKKTGFYEGKAADIRNYIRHVPRVLYHWRVHESSTAENPESKSYAYEAGRHALRAHLRSRGLAYRVRHTEHQGFYYIDYNTEDEKERPRHHGRRRYTEHLPQGDLRFNIPPGLGILNKDYRNITAGIFMRKEVKAVVYRVIDRKGCVEEEPYKGTKWWDSGVMHRSAMPRDLDSPSAAAYCVRTDKTGSLIVYLPYVLFRRL